MFFSAMPASGNYQLKSFDFGTGGGSLSSSSYRLNGLTGNVSGDTSSGSYKLKSGESANENTNVPPAPTFSNPSNYYDRLQLIVNTGNNPVASKFLIAISSDGFATTRYVQPDNTVGNSYTIANYQTYSAWGGASGFYVLGLSPSTNYQVKLKAIQGNFSESAYGPTASASTVSPTLSFGLTTTLTSTPPFTANFSGLTPGSVFSASADAQVALTSNALNGGAIYIRSSNGGLSSSLASYTISSASADLSSANNGYGAQVGTTSQVGGGPLSSVSPFNGVANNVGGLNTSLQIILSTPAAITSGSATIQFKAKSDFNIPSSTDYTDTVFLVAAMTF